MEQITTRSTESRQRTMQEDTYFRVTRLLQEHTDMSQRGLVDKGAISPSALNYCLTALKKNGYVKLENFHGNKHSFKYACILTPSGIAQTIDMTRWFLKRKMEEYEALKNEIKELKAWVGEDAAGSRAQKA